jgi:hypothetical protein
MNGTDLACGTFTRLSEPAAQVKGQSLLVRGEPFIIKGICYESKPLGLCRRIDTDCRYRDTAQGGSNLGFCYGGARSNLWFSAQLGGNCWDSDMVTGENAGRWRKDVDLMAALGVNTIRLYQGAVQRHVSI